MPSLGRSPGRDGAEAGVAAEPHAHARWRHAPDAERSARAGISRSATDVCAVTAGVEDHVWPHRRPDESSPAAGLRYHFAAQRL